MYKFLDLNDKVTIKYENFEGEYVYNVYANEDITLQPNCYYSLTDRIVMEDYIENLELIVSTANINVNHYTDEKLNYTILTESSNSCWDFSFINLTSDEIVLKKDSHIAALKTYINSSSYESLQLEYNNLRKEYDNLRKEYDDLGIIKFNSESVAVFDSKDKIKNITTETTSEKTVIKIYI